MGASISSVGIVTKNRVAGLENVLSSYVDNAKSFGRAARFSIMDDSTGFRTRAECRRMLRRLGAREGVEMSYAGLEEKTDFARALEGAGLSREVVRFALFGADLPGSTVGANRNALLLHTAGELIFNPDDDVHCRVAPAPGKKEGLTFSSGFNSEEFWFFDDAAAAVRAVRFQEKDVLGLHEEFLGRELSGLGRVLVTANGLVGDCALESPRAYLRIRGGSRRRLTASKSRYGLALSRQVVRVVTRPTAGDGSGLFTSAVGLDNRATLAPFMPMFRNEDGLFGLMMKKCFERGLLVQLPWALVHSPAKVRTFRRAEFRRFAPGFRVNDVLQLLIAAYEPAVAGGGLRALGDHLTDRASSSPSEFRAKTASFIRRARSLQVMHLDGLLKAYNGAPKCWANDVRSLRDDLERSLRAPTAVPSELAPGRDRGAGWESFRRMVLKFGALARAWPDLVREARELRGRGVRLARPLGT
ncbi:MAG: hypothetical protein ACHQ2Z_16795 [Elusimicrobiota bacterium]